MPYQKEQNNIVGFYILFAAGIIMDFVPFFGVELMGLSIAIVTLIAAYIYRWRSSLASLTYNHMCYLITTFWVSSLIILVGIVFATLWVYKMGNHTAIMNLMSDMRSGTLMTESHMRLVLEGYMGTNMKLLLTAAASTLSPGLIYLAYRLGVGGWRAFKGEKLSAPTAWFKVS